MRYISLVVAAVLVTSDLTTAFAADRFVSRLGADPSNTCSSAASPCLTIQAAFLQSAGGDHIKIAGGKYKESSGITGSQSITISGGWDEGFASQSNEVPTVITVLTSAAVTIGFAGSTGSVVLDHLTFAKCGLKDPERNPAVGIGANSGGSVTVTIDSVVVGKGQAVSLGIEDGAIDATVTNSVFRKNRGFDGGGLVVTATNGATSIAVRNSTFEGNKTDVARRGGGLAIVTNTPTATLEISGCTFRKNKSFYFGGGLYLYAVSGTTTLDLRNNAFLGNRSQSANSGSSGGAVTLLAAGDLDVTAFNNTFSRNKQKSDSVGFPSTGGLALVGNVTYDSVNEIFNANEPDDYLVRDNSVLNRAYGIYGSGQVLDAGVVADGAGLLLSVDPLLLKSGNDAHLAAASPAIDAGTCTGAPSTDFEGDTRPTGTTCDIGADEFVP